MCAENQIIYVEKPAEYAWGLIGQGITEYNTQHAGEENGQRLCFMIQTPGQEIFGGVIGIVYWDWLCVDLLWLRDEFRGRGDGHRLLMAIEDEARKRGAKHAHLDTFSFQAPEFYKQHGYRVFGELQDFPPGHTRYYLTKDL